MFLHAHRNQNNHTHIAIVHPSSLELMVLDQKGNVLKQDILELDELIIDKPDDVQVRHFFGNQIKDKTNREPKKKIYQID